MPPQMTPQCQETDGALHATCTCTARTEKGVCSQEALRCQWNSVYSKQPL